MDEVVGDADALQHAPDELRHHLVYGGGAGVEGGHGREDDATHLGELGEGAQVADMERRLAEEGDERAALFERHIGGAGDEVARDAVGDAGERLDGAGGNDHAQRAEGAAGDGRADGAVGMHHVGQGFHRFDGPVGLAGDGLRGGGAENEVRLNLGGAQHFEQANAENRAARAAEGDDEPLGVRHDGFPHGAECRLGDVLSCGVKSLRLPSASDVKTTLAQSQVQLCSKQVQARGGLKGCFLSYATGAPLSSAKIAAVTY